MSNLKNKISKLPRTPGVYVYYGKTREVLYVGKAASLQDRVRAYFSGHDKRETVSVMLPQIRDIKIFQTETVLEALILESLLIKKLQPKYNAIGKDDKSFCYFVITKENFPRILIARATQIVQISNFQFLISKKNPKSKIKIQKVYGPYASKKQMEIALKILRKIFPFHSINQQTEKGCLDYELGRCPGPYAGAITQKEYLRNIRGIELILEGRKKFLVKKMEKEMEKCAARRQFEKAADIRNKILALKHIRDVALMTNDYQPKTDDVQPLRIEAYDISNISGKYATGSMVVFRDNEPDKSQYRKFRIKTIRGANDVGMMEEILKRRFKNEWTFPDLILLDGGVAHLKRGEKVLKSLGIKVPIAAAAKDIHHRFRSLKVFYEKSSDQFSLSKKVEKVLGNSELIAKIMAEAHRFALAYHRQLRHKRFFP